MADLIKITENITGQQAADIIFNNDKELETRNVAVKAQFQNIKNIVFSAGTQYATISASYNWLQDGIAAPANKLLIEAVFTVVTASNFNLLLFTKQGADFTLVRSIAVTPVVGVNKVTINETYASDIYIGQSKSGALPWNGSTLNLKRLGTATLAVGASVTPEAITQTGVFNMTINYVDSEISLPVLGAKVDTNTTDIVALKTSDAAQNADLYDPFAETSNINISFDWKSGAFNTVNGYNGYLLNSKPSAYSGYIDVIEFESNAPATDFVNSLQIVELVGGAWVIKSTVPITEYTRAVAGARVTQTILSSILIKAGQYVALRASGILYTNTTDPATNIYGWLGSGTAFTQTSSNRGGKYDYRVKNYTGIKDRVSKIAASLALFGSPALVSSAATKAKNKVTRFYRFNFSQSTTEWTVPAAWTVANGRATTTTAGSRLVLNRRYLSDKRILVSRVMFKADTVARIGGLNVNTLNTVCQIELPNNRIRIYQQSSTSTVLAEIAIPFTVEPDVEYVVELIRNSRVTTLRLINPRTRAVAQVSHDYVRGSNYSAGAGNHRPNYMWELVSGAGFTLIGIDLFGMYRPEKAFAGDSITEANGRCDKNYAETLIETLGDDGAIIAMSGQGIDTMIVSLTNEILYMKPRVLSVLIGTNGTVGAGTSGQYQTIINFCNTNGIELALNYLPCRDNDEHIGKNAVIEAFGFNGARFDIATAKDNYPYIDGTHPAPRINSALFSDGTHPNQDGNDVMAAQVLTDVPLFKNF